MERAHKFMMSVPKRHIKFLSPETPDNSKSFMELSAWNLVQTLVSGQTRCLFILGSLSANGQNYGNGCIMPRRAMLYFIMIDTDLKWETQFPMSVCKNGTMRMIIFIQVVVLRLQQDIKQAHCVGPNTPPPPTHTHTPSSCITNDQMESSKVKQTQLQFESHQMHSKWQW